MAKKKLTASEPAVEPAPKKHAPAVKKTAKVVASVQVAPKLATPVESPAVQEVAETSSQGSIASLAEAVEAPHTPDPERIAQIAYLLWLERGCPQGSPAEDWFRAETVLYGQTMFAVA